MGRYFPSHLVPASPGSVKSKLLGKGSKTSGLEKELVDGYKLIWEKVSTRTCIVFIIIIIIISENGCTIANHVNILLYMYNYLLESFSSSLSPSLPPSPSLPLPPSLPPFSLPLPPSLSLPPPLQVSSQSKKRLDTSIDVEKSAVAHNLGTEEEKKLWLDIDLQLKLLYLQRCWNKPYYGLVLLPFSPTTSLFPSLQGCHVSWADRA